MDLALANQVTVASSKDVLMLNVISHVKDEPLSHMVATNLEDCDIEDDEDSRGSTNLPFSDRCHQPVTLKTENCCDCDVSNNETVDKNTCRSSMCIQQMQKLKYLSSELATAGRDACSKSNKIITDNSISPKDNVSIFVTPKKECTVTPSKMSQDPLTPTANLKVLLHAASPEIRCLEERKKSFKIPYGDVSCDRSPNEPFPVSAASSCSASDTAYLTGNMKENSNRIAAICQLLMQGKAKNIAKSTSEEPPIEDCNLEVVCEPDDDQDDSEFLSFSKLVHDESNSSMHPEDPPSLKFNRKAKSLGLLCQRFLQLYPENPEVSIQISLDDAAKKLGVGRRRIYDIINVLEAIMVVKRIAKNNYMWRGRRGLEHTLAQLRHQAEVTGQAAELREHVSKFYFYDESFSFQSVASIPAPPAPTLDNLKRRDKSLGLLSQKFITLFLVQPGRLVSLEMAAKVLITGGSPAENKYKTKVRRLYDIANILTSLKLIKKVYCQGKKPAFRWVGPLVSYPMSTVPGTVTPLSPPESPAVGSAVANVWKSPQIKVVLPMSDRSLSSLCQVVEQERRDMRLETPVKTTLEITTPIKGADGNCVTVATPVKAATQSSSCVKQATGDERPQGSPEEDFKRELEVLEKRYPSLMSRLLASTCTVPTTISQLRSSAAAMQLHHHHDDHRAIPAPRQASTPRHAHKPPPATSSAVNRTFKEVGDTPTQQQQNTSGCVSLAYLREQQEVITRAVDHAANSGTTSSSSSSSQPASPFPGSGAVRKLADLASLPGVKLLNRVKRVSGARRVVLPKLPSIHFVEGGRIVQPALVNAAEKKPAGDRNAGGRKAFIKLFGDVDHVKELAATNIRLSTSGCGDVPASLSSSFNLVLNPSRASANSATTGGGLRRTASEPYGRVGRAASSVVTNLVERLEKQSRARLVERVPSNCPEAAGNDEPSSPMLAQKRKSSRKLAMTGESDHLCRQLVVQHPKAQTSKRMRISDENAPSVDAASPPQTPFGKFWDENRSAFQKTAKSSKAPDGAKSSTFNFERAQIAPLSCISNSPSSVETGLAPTRLQLGKSETTERARHHRPVTPTLTSVDENDSTVNSTLRCSPCTR